VEVTISDGVKYGGDARVIQNSAGKLLAGLARYCNDAGPRNNVAFTLKPNNKKVIVRPGVRLFPRYEIFVSRGKG